MAELVGIPRLLSALPSYHSEDGRWVIRRTALWQALTDQVYSVGRLRQNCAINEDTKSARARYWRSGCFPELRYPVNPGLAGE